MHLIIVSLTVQIALIWEFIFFWEVKLRTHSSAFFEVLYIDTKTEKVMNLPLQITHWLIFVQSLAH